MPRPNSRPKADTLPLTVHNTGFLLDRLGEDCHPLQFLRELTQNAIEAIQRCRHPRGDVLWDVDWTQYELDERPVYKLCVTDTGDGMTGEEMLRYINQLSSSLGEPSLTGHYGVGAKIAAATRNHYGLLYLSWKAGRGSMIHLWRDPETAQYGLRQFARPDGTFSHVAEVEDSVRPKLIDGHGTMIVLMGHTADEDTMKAPDRAPSPSRWISKYLNTRYFKIPQGIGIRCREGWEHPRSDKDRNVLRQVVGQHDYLKEHAESSGQVTLSSATAHWWILRDEAALSQNSGWLESSGHIAALYNDELYETSTARAGRARLQQFGVLFGTNRVVIYVEPDTEGQSRITTNTARTRLLLGNEDLPWTEWATEFRERMPSQLVALIEEVGSKASASDHTTSIRERLKQIMDLYRVSRYRFTPAGKLLVDDERLDRGGLPEPSDGVRGGGTGGRSGRKGGTAGGVYGVFLKKDGEAAERVQPDVFPRTKWVSVADGTREVGDIEDRAARYIPEENVLLINADFRVFTDLVDRWMREFGKAGVREVVQEAVHGWFEQTLVETVIGVQALKGSKEWSLDALSTALSEEALTSAVMPRYHVNFAVKRELGSKLGKLEST